MLSPSIPCIEGLKLDGKPTTSSANSPLNHGFTAQALQRMGEPAKEV